MRSNARTNRNATGPTIRLMGGLLRRSELFASGAAVALAASAVLAGPEGAQVARGDVRITRNGAETVIRAGNNSIINYRSFDIARHETVRFIQPSASSRV